MPSSHIHIHIHSALLVLAGMGAGVFNSISSSTSTSTFALAAPSRRDDSWQSIGCFSDDINQRQMTAKKTSTSTTVSTCQTYCMAKKYIYSGLQNGNECWCSLNQPSLGKVGGCDAPCAGDQNSVCGGNGAISVFYYGPPIQVKRVQFTGTNEAGLEFGGCSF